MDEIKIEILNPKAMQLIKGMQDLNLIKISENPNSLLKEYLNKMRRNSSDVPDIEEIANIVNEVREKRYANKKTA
ncbi:MAG: hypothetical protein ABIW47_11340 [Ginsengibacter sp.]|jgi:hypothetical protein